MTWIERVDFLILGGTVVSMDGEDRVRENSGVAVWGDRIVAIDHNDILRARFPTTPILEAKHKAILPGLVDSDLNLS